MRSPTPDEGGDIWEDAFWTVYVGEAKAFAAPEDDDVRVVLAAGRGSTHAWTWPGIRVWRNRPAHIFSEVQRLATSMRPLG